MNKNKFISVLAARLRIPRVKAKKFIESFFSSLTDTLKENGTITLRGFGSFKIVERKERKIINPKTKKYYKTSPKKILTFKPYNKFKKLLK